MLSQKLYDLKKEKKFSPVPKNSANSNPANIPEASALEDIEDPHWYNIDSQDEENWQK